MLAHDKTQPSPTRGQDSQLSGAPTLLTHIAGNLAAEITRFTKSRHIARSRRARVAADGEPICAARSPEACWTRTVLRLDLRQTGKTGDKVNRFSSLSYAETVENGVGLVLDDDGRITGGKLFGPPSCNCRVRQTVDTLTGKRTAKMHIQIEHLFLSRRGSINPTSSFLHHQFRYSSSAACSTPPQYDGQRMTQENIPQSQL